MKKLLLALSLTLLATPCFAQQQVQVIGKNLSTPTGVANPLPVETEVGGVIPSASNPIPVQLSQGGAVLSATNGLPIASPSTTTAANSTSVNGSVGGTAATTSLTAGATHITLTNLHASQTLYFAITGTATTSNYALPGNNLPSSTIHFDIAPGISGISLIGSGSGTTFSLFAD